jgi:hypothetical protein
VVVNAAQEFDVYLLMYSELPDYRLTGLCLICLGLTQIDRRLWITAWWIYVRPVVNLE